MIPEPILISQTNPSSRCVLIVEDEFFCRFHAVDLVEAAGFSAIEASNADEAIAIYQTLADQPDRLAALERDCLEFATRSNRGTPGSAAEYHYEYLLVVARKAREDTA